MPTKAFYNLDINKQKCLLDAAKKEFSENLFESASINKIIKDINMPRGSFYLYFENKEDIYLYIFEIYLNEFKRVLFNLLEQNNHDIFKSVICFYDYIVDHEKVEQKLITNIFANMNSKQLEFALFKLLKNGLDGYLINIIAYDNNLITEEDMNVAISIIFPLLFMSVNKSLSGVCDKKKVRYFYIKQINMIKNGLERK